MSFFTSTQTDLLAILEADGEALIYTDRDGNPDVPFTSVMHRNGEDGDAIINIPVSVATSPVFADKITDGNTDVWYIMSARETLQGRTYCQLKLSTYWKTGNFEVCDSSGVWSLHTSDVLMMVTEDNSYEDIDDSGYFTETLESTIRTRHLDSPTQKMRINIGGVLYFITGKRDDDTGTRWTEWNCRRDEA